MAASPNMTLKSDCLVIAQATLSQTRTTTTTNGLPGFQVLNVMYTPGPLQDTGVFLVQIVDPNTTSSDVLARVCSVADTLTYATNRAIAISNNQLYYRSPSWTATYPDLDSAIAGAQAFKDRTNKLVGDWINYSYTFNSPLPGKLYTLPSSDQSVLSQLINNWVAAHAGTATALAALTLANNNLTTANNNLTTATNNYNSAVTIQTNTNGLASMSTGFQALINACNVVLSRIGTKGSPYPTTAGTGLDLWTSFNNLLQVINTTASVPAAVTTQAGIFQNSAASVAGAGSSQLSQLQTDLASAMTSARTYPTNTSAATSAANSSVTSFNSTLTTAQNNVTNAQQTQLIAQATYNNAVTTEASALAAVTAVYPAFDSNNPFAALSL